MYVFGRDRRRDFLLGAADGAHEDAVAKFGSAGWANHGINSYSLSTIVGSILYVKKLYFNNVNGIYNNLHNWDNRDILLIITTNNCKKEGEWRFETKNWFEYTDFDWFGHRGLGRIFVP